MHLTFHKQRKLRDKQQDSWRLAVVSSLTCSVSVLLADISHSFLVFLSGVCMQRMWFKQKLAHFKGTGSTTALLTDAVNTPHVAYCVIQTSNEDLLLHMSYLHTFGMNIQFKALLIWCICVWSSVRVIADFVNVIKKRPPFFSLLISLSRSPIWNANSYWMTMNFAAKSH